MALAIFSILKHFERLKSRVDQRSVFGVPIDNLRSLETPLLSLTPCASRLVSALQARQPGPVCFSRIPVSNLEDSAAKPPVLFPTNSDGAPWTTHQYEPVLLGQFPGQGRNASRRLHKPTDFESSEPRLSQSLHQQ